MDQHKLWYQTVKINKTIDHLKKHKIQAEVVLNSEKLMTKLDTLIEEDSKVGVGDSMTLEELGVYNYLRNRKINFLDKYQKSLTKKQKRLLYIENFSADSFITGSNAISETGEIYNIDGNGSRVAPMIYGPKQVIIIIGSNKIVRNLEEAVQRTRQIAAPIDAKRLGKQTPCTKLGHCIDCQHKDRICNYFVTITGQFEGRIKVLIVGGDYGY